MTRETTCVVLAMGIIILGEASYLALSLGDKFLASIFIAIASGAAYQLFHELKG